MPGPPSTRVSVVLTASENRMTVEAAIERALASPLVAEVLVIDDASADGTAEAAGAVSDPRVRVQRQPFPMGRGAGLRRGLSEASADVVVVSRADDPQASWEYQRLVAPIEAGDADAVYASRAGSDGTPDRLVTAVSNALTGLTLTDVTTPLKAFRREVVEALEVDETGAGFDAALTARLVHDGYRIVEVPADRGTASPRAGGLGAGGSLRGVAAAVRHWPRWPRKDVARVGGLTDDVDDELTDTLDNLDDATNYADWIVDQFGDHLHGTVVEIGAGSGTITERLCRRADHVVATDLSPTRIAELQTRFGRSDRVEVVEGDAASVLAGRTVDAVVMVNVLEHIGDDVGVLGDLYAALRPGGVVALFVPAHPGLYSDFDRRIGHFRRYTRATLATTLSRAGFEVPMIRYVNAPGAIAWWLIARTLNRTPTSGPLVRIYDQRVVPLLRRLESGRSPGFGQSLVALGRRPG